MTPCRFIIIHHSLLGDDENLYNMWDEILLYPTDDCYEMYTDGKISAVIVRNPSCV